MAHELTIREDGKVEMAFRQGTAFPWHFAETKPQQVPANATTYEWQKAAGMEWQVDRAALSFTYGGEVVERDGQRFMKGGTREGYPAAHMLVRSDTGAPLGIVSRKYEIVQPGEVIEFFEDLVHVVGLELDTAGTMFGGKRFWALARIGEQAMVDQRDLHKGYLLLTTSADGSTATEARFTDVRVVCNNTLSMAMGAKTAGTVKVTHRSKFVPDAVKRQLGVAPETFEAFMGKMRKLADVRLSRTEAETHVKAAFGKSEADRGDEGALYKRVMDLFRGLAKGSNLPGVQGTAYGLLNAYTEASDWKSRAGSDSHRLANALVGSGDKAKTLFRDRMLALVD